MTALEVQEKFRHIAATSDALRRAQDAQLKEPSHDNALHAQLLKARLDELRASLPKPRLVWDNPAPAGYGSLENVR